MAHIDISLAKYMLKLIGQTGGIAFNTNMISHDGMRENISGTKKRRLKEKEIMIIGTPDVPINVNDILDFLNKLKKHVEDKAFDSGRTYWFEGIYKGEDGYSIMWGS